MGWHVHTKNGKFNIWSTICDEYLLKEWVSEQEVRQAYCEYGGEINEAIEAINRAKEFGFCSCRIIRSRCTDKETEDFLLIKNKIIQENVK